MFFVGSVLLAACVGGCLPGAHQVLDKGTHMGIALERGSWYGHDDVAREFCSGRRVEFQDPRVAELQSEVGLSQP